MINLLIDPRHVSPAMCVILTRTDVAKGFYLVLSKLPSKKRDNYYTRMI